MNKGEDVTSDQLLVSLNLSEEAYLLAIRSSLNSLTVFLKWQLNELRVNKYKAGCLSAWTANIDSQFVLDVYACATVHCLLHLKRSKGDE